MHRSPRLVRQIGRHDAVHTVTPMGHADAVPHRPGVSARTCCTRSSAPGVIVSVEGRGSDARVMVNFRQVGLKWLALEYAKLTAA